MRKRRWIALAAGFLALVSGGLAQSTTKIPGFIIDSHTHYNPRPDFEKSFLATYQKYNAMACLLISMKDLDRGLVFAKAHLDRVIPYAEIDIDSPTVIEDIRKVHAMGFQGLGELFAVNQWDYDDPKYDPIWKLAEELGLPIAPHTGILATGQMARMRPAFLATIAVKFPKLFIHAAHFGNPWYEEAGEATRRNRNLFEKGEKGAIVSTASGAGRNGSTVVDYGASKAAVINMTQTWARELGKFKIRVNAVAPGFIATEMVQAMPPKVLEGMVAKTPVGRMGRPEDIADAYVWLASDQATFVHGTVLCVDGGLVIGT